MDSKLKVTDVPEEASFYDLVAGDNVLEIPLFQRPYMWRESHYNALLGDVELVADEAAGASFLGVIVSFSRGAGPGRPPTWMIVDGQQRVTTLYLIVMAAVEVAAAAGDLDWAADTMGRYLLVRPMSGLSVNTKLVPSYNDRQQFCDLWARIAAVKNFATHQIVASNPPKPPSPSGLNDGNMKAQYMRVRADLNKLLKAGGLNALEQRIDIVVTRLSVVSISLRDPAVAPKIFERLNYGAEPITVADLVRNEVFARSGDDPATAHHLFSTRWEPFVAKFKDKNSDLDKFLFPYGLITNPNSKKADLFASLRKKWENFGNPAEIIGDMEQFQPAYLALNAGIPYVTPSLELRNRVNRLHRAGKPSSVFPFILQVLRAYEENRIEESTVVNALDAIESFLFRRAISGIEPTGLHAVFKGLWQELCPIDTAEPDVALSTDKIIAAIKSKATIAWPSDEEFKTAIINGELYRRKIVAYAIREYELACDGESPSDVLSVEHIAPQSPTPNWESVIPENYSKLVHTWGNLLPLTPAMNPVAGQSPFSKKRESYKDSIFASAREVAKVEQWDASTILARSAKIADWAVHRWPH